MILSRLLVLLEVLSRGDRVGMDEHMNAKVKEQRVEIRRRVENFLSAEQLAQWDAEMTKAREFFGEKIDA